MVDFTNLTNATTLQGVAEYTNNATGGVLFQGGIFMFFIIMMIILTKNDEPFENALAVSSWSMFVVSAMFWFAELIPTIIPLAFLMLASISVLILYTKR
jgi:hypothetical protein